MAIDFEAIKRKLAELESGKKASTTASSSVQLWKPEAGEYTVRVVPWPKSMTQDGMPFVERWFYYDIGKRPIVAPEQFGKPDPIKDLRMKMFKSGTPEDKALGKTLFAQPRAYIPIIVRDGDEEQIMIWALNKTLHQKMLGWFLLKGVGDYMDPAKGFDIEVKKKKIPGKTYPDTSIELSRFSTPLSEDPDVVKRLLENVPSIDDVYPQMTEAEISKRLKEHLDSGLLPDNSTLGAERGEGDTDVAASVDDALDALTTEVAHVEEEKPKKSPPPAKAAPKPSSSKAKDLDDAFAELESDD